MCKGLINADMISVIKLVIGVIIIASILLSIVAVGYGGNCLQHKELITLRDLDLYDYLVLAFDGFLIILAVLTLGGLGYVCGSCAFDFIGIKL